MKVENIIPLPIQELFFLKNQIEAQFAEIKKQKEAIEEAIELRYVRKAMDLLADKGQHTGTIHFNDDVYTISAVIPKKVNWDQEILESAMHSMSYEQRKQYIEISYKVLESKYLTHCPAIIRSLLEPAREVVVGKPKFTIELENK